MQVTRKIARIDTTDKLTVAFDVGKDSLNYYSEIAGKVSGTSCREMQVVEDAMRNRTESIIKGFGEIEAYAHSVGKNGLHVVCEPTGSYSDRLMRIARERGHSTAYVSGESTNKAKVIENNDGSKSDIKDPRVIFMLSCMGKELTYRALPPEYQYLRDLNRMYDDTDDRRKSARCLMHNLLFRLFCDFPLSKDFVYTASGAALMTAFMYNPYRIATVSYEQFTRRMTEHAPGITRRSLEKIYASAKQCILHQMGELEQKALEQRLRYEWEEHQTMTARRTELRGQIEEVYCTLRDQGDLVPLDDPKVFTAFHLGRFLGETGPLGDFPNAHALHKYGGMNLRTRESGAFKGRVKFSKKGRTHLRGVTGRLAFRLVRGHEIFGTYHHKRKAEGECGTKIIANVERKLVRILFAMGIRRESFNEQRFIQCESEYRKAA